MTDMHERIREFWDDDAQTYDETIGHAISDPVEAAAWRAALLEALPARGARVLDVGAGTGSLSLLAAELGFEVTALDLSPAMLARAGQKAKAAGLGGMTFVVGSATDPPAGPFDAVMQRHVLWTLPDPVGALRAWHTVTKPEGRLVLFDGVWGPADSLQRGKDVAARAVRKIRGIPSGHHATYPQDVLAKLPLAGSSSPAPLLAAAAEAGWKALRITRLRDVEWAQQLREAQPFAWLERHPGFVVIADA
jgi:SAM-dependent methyltransferase